MSTNYVSILRSPLIGNAYAPIRLQLDTKISLESAIAQAQDFAREKGYDKPSYLFWDNKTYRFMNSGVFLMDASNRPIKKVG